MTKPIHPVRKLQVAIRRASAYESRPNEFIDSVAARHVAPLLDALEFDHTARWHPKHDPHCEICRLLDAWRAEP